MSSSIFDQCAVSAKEVSLKLRADAAAALTNLTRALQSETLHRNSPDVESRTNWDAGGQMSAEFKFLGNDYSRGARQVHNRKYSGLGNEECHLNAYFVASQNVVDVLSARAHLVTVVESGIHALIHLTRAIYVEYAELLREPSEISGKRCADSLLAGPRHPTSRTIHAVILVMGLHPDVMRIQMAGCMAFAQFYTCDALRNVSSSPNNEQSLRILNDDQCALRSQVPDALAAIDRALTASFRRSFESTPHIFVVHDAAARAMCSISEHELVIAHHRPVAETASRAVLVNVDKVLHALVLDVACLNTRTATNHSLPDMDASGISCSQDAELLRTTVERILQVLTLSLNPAVASFGATDYGKAVATTLLCASSCCSHVEDICFRTDSVCQFCALLLNSVRKMLSNLRSSCPISRNYIKAIVVIRELVLRELLSVLSRHLRNVDVLSASLMCIVEAAALWNLDEESEVPTDLLNLTCVAPLPEPSSRDVATCSEVPVFFLAVADVHCTTNRASALFRCFCRIFEEYKDDVTVRGLVLDCATGLCENDVAMQEAAGACGIIEQIVKYLQVVSGMPVSQRSSHAEKYLVALYSICRNCHENAMSAVAVNACALLLESFVCTATVSEMYALSYSLLLTELSLHLSTSKDICLKSLVLVAQRLLAVMRNNSNSLSVVTACMRGVEKVCQMDNQVSENMVEVHAENVILLVLAQHVQFMSVVTSALSVLTSMVRRKGDVALQLATSAFPCVLSQCLRVCVSGIDGGDSNSLTLLLLFVQSVVRDRLYLRQKYISNGIVEEIMSAIHRCQECPPSLLTCLECALDCLRKMFFNSERAKQAFHDRDGPKAISSLLGRSKLSAKGLALCCSIVLHSCHDHRGNVEMYVQASVIDLLIALLKIHDHDHGVISSALKALAVFATYDRNLREVDASLREGIGLAIHAMRIEPGYDSLFFSSCIFLSAMTLDCPANRSRIVDGGGRTAVVFKLSTAPDDSHSLRIAARLLVDLQDRDSDPTDSDVFERGYHDEKKELNRVQSIQRAPSSKWNVVRAVLLGLGPKD